MNTRLYTFKNRDLAKLRECLRDAIYSAVQFTARCKLHGHATRAELLDLRDGLPDIDRYKWRRAAGCSPGDDCSDRLIHWRVASHQLQCHTGRRSV